MSAVKTSVRTSLYAVNTATEYSEKGATTIDHLPRGTALHAARTPLSKEKSRTGAFPKQPSGTGAPASMIVTSEASNSTAESTDPATNEPPRKESAGPDLARRAARRVNVWKKSEQDRRGEEERARQVKQEQDKRRQNHTAHAKQRRRAEIYALNALLRQLQQDKLARYIAAQKQLQEAQEQENGAALASSTAALALVQAVGA
ncbi:hypothetical protein PHYPSEUDO_009304 [Phytophthora pseudosyringae]|uniref:Small vasohibin-binding protein n=1 Tax=Phytophthora pseudosyringae TaxID=221518 RepID=A0A8T1VC60_9STRA|nr:hypothetical protein PHYPSEUDO_009304 [Phytophthora pseudosyringae]